MNKWEIIFYKTWENTINIEVFFQGETVWLPQKKIAELFDVDRTVVTKHIKNIFDSLELNQNIVCANFAHTANDWKIYNTNFYNLDVIIAVWYRVNSKKATSFRIWATNILKEFIKKGFVLDDERLKNWQIFWKDYFEELLERIRDIRSSERRFYQKITDIYATSIDYDKNNEITKQFFAAVQNKLHFAISWNTASELIYNRVGSEKENMWLTSWKTSPKWKIVKSDVVIAKNYLTEIELKKLNMLVNAYLDIAEFQAMSWELMTMKDWKERFDEFLKLNRQKILENAWKITSRLAEEKAIKEYEKFKPIQDQKYLSDFDDFVENIKKKIN